MGNCPSSASPPRPPPARPTALTRHKPTPAHPPPHLGTLNLRLVRGRDAPRDVRPPCLNPRGMPAAAAVPPPRRLRPGDTGDLSLLRRASCLYLPERRAPPALLRLPELLRAGPEPPQRHPRGFPEPPEPPRAGEPGSGTEPSGHAPTRRRTRPPFPLGRRGLCPDTWSNNDSHVHVWNVLNIGQTTYFSISLPPHFPCNNGSFSPWISPPAAGSRPSVPASIPKSYLWVFLVRLFLGDLGGFLLGSFLIFTLSQPHLSKECCDSSYLFSFGRGARRELCFSLRCRASWLSQSRQFRSSRAVNRAADFCCFLTFFLWFQKVGEVLESPRLASPLLVPKRDRVSPRTPSRAPGLLCFD